MSVRDLLENAGLLTPQVVAAQLDGALLDLHADAPAEPPGDLRAIRVTDPEALSILRHSSAHVLADAVQRLYPGTKVTFGPAIEGGFYYDFDRPQGQFTDGELRDIEAKMLEIIEQDHPFERRVVTKGEARTLLEGLGETYKIEHLDRIEDPISVYQHGPWVDLCSGPHVPSTRFLKAFKLTSVAGAYWRGDERNPMLQRIYGTAFSSPKELKKHLHALEEAKKRDHRKLGKELELMVFHPWAPASPFFLPRGAAIYTRLVQYVRSLYEMEGYDEVVTPQLFDKKLFETSGHLPAYEEAMFFATTAEEMSSEHPEEVRMGVKPMNCPGHALMFSMQRWSYRDLPFRMADFGRLHRNERSGVLQGLTRVRTFAQDDAHIFCTMDQVQSEIESFVDLVHRVYEDFGFLDVQTVLATRPDKRLGSDEVWDRAEAALDAGLRAKGLQFEVAQGEGAFYGPKVEFHLRDALGRPWQLGTIQADFNLPERFDLQYVGADNATHRPVMLHRAILGSIERFLGILIEHVGGAFPTWLAPEQITLLTVAQRFNDHAEAVARQLRAQGFRVKVDGTADKLGAKIRSARLKRIPMWGVIGEKEATEGGVSLRLRASNEDLGWMTVGDLAARLAAESLPPSQQVASQEVASASPSHGKDAL